MSDLGAIVHAGPLVVALEESSPASALVFGSVMIAIGLMMLVKRARLIDLFFYMNRAFSDSDRSSKIARYNVIGGAAFLLVVGVLVLLSVIGWL